MDQHSLLLIACAQWRDEAKRLKGELERHMEDNGELIRQVYEQREEIERLERALEGEGSDD